MAEKVAKQHKILLGKIVKKATVLRGGGSAFPGLFMEKIDPDFIANCLSQLSEGVVVISGTNGKTTTTKMVVELLESQGMKVFTNRTGSNFTRGVASSLLEVIDTKGNLDADIAVLELDEAHAVHFVRTVKPRFSLLLNVMRDQLDRFGEIDTTAKLLEVIAEATTETVLVNREDQRLVQFSSKFPKTDIQYFGLDASLRSKFPNDDDMRSKQTKTTSERSAISILYSLRGNDARFKLAGSEYTTSLQLQGIYNVFNAAAALGLVALIRGKKLDTSTLIQTLATVRPAFGRGETLLVDGLPLELVLVKNPSGFRLGLSSFSSKGYATMIAINDNYADGRDMSWLWDVDFDSLKEEGVSMLSGIRAYDIALRLQYDEVEIGHVNPDLGRSLKEFIAHNKQLPKRIYCTYTAMLALRKALSSTTRVDKI